MKLIFHITISQAQKDYLEEAGRGNKSQALAWIMRKVQPEHLGEALAMRIQRQAAPGKRQLETSVATSQSDLDRIRYLSEHAGLSLAETISLAIDFHRIHLTDVTAKMGEEGALV